MISVTLAGWPTECLYVAKFVTLQFSDIINNMINVKLFMMVVPVLTEILHIHTAFSHFHSISRLQHCQTFLTENLIFLFAKV